jgi:ubiquinol-cytochrome c reductase cytochrome c1 subunit
VKKQFFFFTLATVLAGPVFAAGGEVTLVKRDWSFNGPFGTFDKAAMQRGFQVYREVCSGCHSLKYIAFRNFSDLGYNEAEIKVIAAEYDVEDGPNDEGEMFERPGIPADRMPSPYPNDNAARAGNGGALPPDLSLITKARASGPDYLYSLLIGYKEAPTSTAVPDGMYYNDAYPGHLIAMPQPLYGDDVTYSDGSDPSIEGSAADLTQFLMWTAEPKLEVRKRIGVAVVFFLSIFVMLSIMAKRRIWAGLH